MMWQGKKLGILLSCDPESPNFEHACRLTRSALEKGVIVYLYCLDDAVKGVGDKRIQELKQRGMKLFGCAYGAQRRDLPMREEAIYSGLTVLSDFFAHTDRFLSFN